MDKMGNNREYWLQDKFNNKIAENAVILAGCEVSNCSVHEWSRLKRFVEFRDSTLGAYTSISSH